MCYFEKLYLRACGFTDMDGKHSLGRVLSSILLWWFFNVMTVVSNKWIFQVLTFQFPLTVTVIHLLISALGGWISIEVLKLKPLIKVNSADHIHRILPMSAVFCVNIVLGNVSLRYIPVSFMQTIKSLTPATTLVLQWLVWKKSFDRRVWLSLIPVVGGIMVASLTELSFNMIGFLAAFCGCLVTSTKTILAEKLLHGYNFDSINTVYYMAPYAASLLLVPTLFLEGQGVFKWAEDQSSLMLPSSILVISGTVAFCLNFSIFYVIQSTTALTFNVAGNLKVAVAIIVSWLIFRNPISIWNAFGCVITLLGCMCYGYISQVVSRKQEVALLPAMKPDRF